MKINYLKGQTVQLENTVRLTERKLFDPNIENLAAIPYPFFFRSIKYQIKKNYKKKHIHEQQSFIIDYFSFFNN